jgi:hypothetical protein
MEDVGIFYGHFVYFTAKWYILWPLGTFCDIFVYFFPLLVSFTEKYLATLPVSVVLTFLHFFARNRTSRKQRDKNVAKICLHTLTRKVRRPETGTVL